MYGDKCEIFIPGPDAAEFNKITYHYYGLSPVKAYNIYRNPADG